MAKINTLNYQTVASWNGSQDLFLVEQPDGTKVATPAMFKQFIEAGNFEATGEVKDGHGNILADMAKSADVNTALAGKQNTLTFDNVPTQNSNNPVKSGGIYSKIGDLTQTGVTGDSVAAQLTIEKGQIASLQTNRAYCVDVGTVIGNNPNELLGAAWDKLTIYGVPVLVNYQNYGQHMALMFKYNAAGDYGMAIGMRYGTTSIIKMGVNNGTKTYATT